MSFIVPAMLITGALGWAYARFGKLSEAAWLLWGVKPVILAVVVQALWNLTPTAARTWPLRILGGAAVAAAPLGVNELVILFSSGALIAALRGWRPHGQSLRQIIPALPIAAGAASLSTVSLSGLFWVFFKIGSVLFGSGYVLLAFLRADLVQSVLYVFVVLAHDRRRVLHFNVTEHPTAAWTAQQIVEAFPRGQRPEILDTRSRSHLRRGLPQPPQGHGRRGGHECPALPVAESLRRAPDRVGAPRMSRPCGHPGRAPSAPNPGIVLRLLPPRADPSVPREICAHTARRYAPNAGKVVELPEVGGLHHRYERRAA